MRYRTQAVAYPYFVVALLLYGLQIAFGLLAAVKYLGPDPIKAWLPFDVTKEIHTNLLIVWVLTGFMGAGYWLVPEESRTELHSPKLAYVALALWTLVGLTAVIGYLFGWTAGNKLLEQPLPVKLGIVVVMLMFLYNLGMTIWKAKRLTTTEAILMAGLVMTALLYLPALLEFRNYTVAIFYRWWTVHLWVEGVWEMIQGALLAYLLIRLSGIDREVMEKWLYVIVGLTFISGLLGTAHHYYYVGVPRYWLPIGGFFSALEPLGFLAMSAYAYSAIRRSGMSHPNTLALHWTLGSAVFSALGAGLLGLAHTWPAVNKWTHGTLITPMHGHAAFFGAYVMIVLAVITYALPALTGHAESERESKVGLWAFWLQVGGMFGMTMAFAAAGISQTYLERILGFGYLETQSKIQVHFLMLLATGIAVHPWCGAVPVGLLLPGAVEAAAGGDRRGACRTAERLRRLFGGPPSAAGLRRIDTLDCATRRRGSLLPARRRRNCCLRNLSRSAARRHAEGTDRLRQDALRRAHGVAARTAARHRRVPRRSVGQRSHGPLSDSRRRDRLARRPADARGEAGRDLLSRRDHRGTHRHGRRHPPADRRSADSAARQGRRAARGGSELSARRLVQPRLSARAEGSEAEHPTAVRRARVRLSAGGARIGNRQPRRTRRSAHGDRSGHAHDVVCASSATAASPRCRAHALIVATAGSIASGIPVRARVRDGTSRTL